MDENDGGTGPRSPGRLLEHLDVAAGQPQDFGAIDRELRILRLLGEDDRIQGQQRGQHHEDPHEDLPAGLHEGSRGRRPSSPDRAAIASIRNATCSSKSTPNSSAPRATSSRSTPAANEGWRSFLRTDFGFIPSMPVGRTSAQAAMNPESSSTAKSALAISVLRGTPMNSACPATASITSWG